MAGNANWSNPTLSTTKVNWPDEIRQLAEDALMMLDQSGTPATSTNLPTGAKRWNDGSSRWEIYNGTSWDALAASYAITVTGVTAGAINATALGTNAVTEIKINAGAVTSGKLGSNAVIAGKIAAGAINNSADFAAGVVDSTALGANAVIAGKIAAGAINNSADFTAGVVNATALGTNAVTSVKINAGAVIAGKIGALAVGSTELASSAVTTAKIDALAVTQAKIGALQVSQGKIADNAINQAKLTHASGADRGGSQIWDATGVPVILQPGAAGEVLTGQGAAAPPAWAPPALFGLQTAIPTTSGTTKDFNNLTSVIPVPRRITITYAGVSLSSGAELTIRLGDATSFESSGYSGSVGDNSDHALFSSAFQLVQTGVAGANYHGQAILTLLDASTNTWTISGSLSRADLASLSLSGFSGSKSLSGPLTRVRVTSTTPDTFDAGKVGCLVE